VKKVALVGSHGMLGRDLATRLKESFSIVSVGGRGELDITDREGVLRWVASVRPDILINAAAFTDVDACETQRERAFSVNGEGPGYLAEACAESGTWMVQISTDFVFDGARREPYREEDPPNPLSVYGASKLMGEQRIQEKGARFLIVRTSWLYGTGGRNFVEAILSQAEKREDLRVVSDQVGSPTYVPDLTRALLRLIASGATGTVHVANSGQCSWFGFAKRILLLTGFLDTQVSPILSSDLNRPARRPVYSVLSGQRYSELCSERMRPWEEGLQAYLEERVLSRGRKG